MGEGREEVSWRGLVVQEGDPEGFFFLAVQVQVQDWRGEETGTAEGDGLWDGWLGVHMHGMEEERGGEEHAWGGNGVHWWALCLLLACLAVHPATK